MTLTSLPLSSTSHWKSMMKKEPGAGIKQEDSAVIARGSSGAKEQPLHAPGGPWAGHGHIGPGLPGPLIARLEGFPEFTMSTVERANLKPSFRATSGHFVVGSRNLVALSLAESALLSGIEEINPGRSFLLEQVTIFIGSLLWALAFV